MSGKILALYIRLSLEDGDLKTSADKSESNSVTNQRKLLLDYLTSHEELRRYDVVEFCDDGYSGTSFNRPNFMRMMELVRQGEVQCIVVKDLSRFGREYLEVGAYLELVLPLFGTRFVSVNDQFDSNDYVGTTGGIELALHNLINGMYSKDLSVKIRSAIKTRNRRGQYWGGSSFYGYLPDPQDKHRLVVDEAVRQNVELIFELCIAGMSTMQIAKHLNDLGIPSPAKYKKQKGEQYNGRIMEDGPAWIGGTIRRILTDERYTGKMVSGTREMVGIRTNKMKSLPREEWFIVKGKHEAIISDEIYSAAAESLHSRIRTVNQNTSGNRAHNLFVCGYCGRKLQKSNGKKIHLFCIQARSKNCPDCELLHEDMEMIQTHALAVVKAHASMLLNRSAFIKKHDASQQSRLQREIKEAEAKLKSIAGGKTILYEEYRSGKHSKEAYLHIQQRNLDESDALNRRLNDLKEELELWKQSAQTFQRAGKQAEEIQVLTEYKPEVICMLVDAIRIFDGGRMEVTLKNEDAYAQLFKESDDAQSADLLEGDNKLCSV